MLGADRKVAQFRLVGYVVKSSKPHDVRLRGRHLFSHEEHRPGKRRQVRIISCAPLGGARAFHLDAVGGCEIREDKGTNLHVG